MTTTEILLALAIPLFSFVTFLIQKATSRQTDKAGVIKLKNESGQMVLEGELKLTGFYKDQLENIITKYNLMEKRLEERNREYTTCQDKVAELEERCIDLQRQITLLNIRLDNQH